MKCFIMIVAALLLTAHEADARPARAVGRPAARSAGRAINRGVAAVVNGTARARAAVGNIHHHNRRVVVIAGRNYYLNGGYGYDGGYGGYGSYDTPVLTGASAPLALGATAAPCGGSYSYAAPMLLAAPAYYAQSYALYGGSYYGGRFSYGGYHGGFRGGFGRHR